jgi:acyl dehydratase
MDAPVSKLHWEDFAVGSVATCGPRVVTREEIIAFAREFDPQPFHLDEEAGRASMLGGLCASGWHICCLMMRLIADGFLNHTTSMGAPGVDEVKWRLPLRPGDSITARITVTDKRASKSRPDMGFVRIAVELLNQSGACVMTLTTPMMMARREPAVVGADGPPAGREKQA